MDALKLAEIGALVGDPARANILAALMDGRALTASELAYLAGVSAQTTSGHLAKLTESDLLTVERQGRHRYFRLASPLVGRMLEGIMVVAGHAPAHHRTRWRGGEALRHARTCYDHLAGRVAVKIADALIARAHIVLSEDGGEVTPSGEAFFAAIGLRVPSPSRRVFCRPCLDWSERRPHLAGALGAALLSHALEQGWVQRLRDTRALAVTGAGERAFAAGFGLSTESCGHASR